VLTYSWVRIIHRGFQWVRGWGEGDWRWFMGKNHPQKISMGERVGWWLKVIYIRVTNQELSLPYLSIFLHRTRKEIISCTVWWKTVNHDIKSNKYFCQVEYLLEKWWLTCIVGIESFIYCNLFWYRRIALWFNRRRCLVCIFSVSVWLKFVLLLLCTCKTWCMQLIILTSPITPVKCFLSTGVYQFNWSKLHV
jgi:hypothetical protein